MSDLSPIAPSVARRGSRNAEPAPLPPTKVSPP